MSKVVAHRRCVRCHRDAGAGSLLCSDCVCLVKQAEDDRVLQDRAELKAYLSGGGTTAERDDWREVAYSRASLQRPYGLFPSSSLTWRKLSPAPRATVRRAPTRYYECGLWPIEFRCAHVQLKDVVEGVLSLLSVQEEYVLRLRFGIGMTDEHSFEEIAEAWHLSGVRVRQIHGKALRKLRSPKLSKLLAPFYVHEDGSGRFND